MLYEDRYSQCVASACTRCVASACTRCVTVSHLLLSVGSTIVEERDKTRRDDVMGTELSSLVLEEVSHISVVCIISLMTHENSIYFLCLFRRDHVTTCKQQLTIGSVKD